jgi:DNA polymerase-3 subunit delta
VSKATILDWRSVRPADVILVSGPEDYLADRAIKSVRTQLRKTSENLEISDVDASDYASGQLLNLTSPSLFAEPRLLIFKNVERCTDALITDGIDYLSAPTSDTTVILRHNGSSVRGKKLLDSIRGSAKSVEVSCLKISKDADRAAFVQNEFIEANRQIVPAATKALLEAFNDDLAELAAACSQLLQDSAETIDASIVEKYYGGRVETNGFKVLDAAFSGESGKALALLRHALASGSDPVPILAGMAMKMRQLAKLSSNRSATAAQIGMAPWQLDQLQRVLRGWSEEGLANIMLQLASTDAAIKGAEKDAVFALEKLVLNISGKGTN